MILVNLLPPERRYVPLALEHAELADAQDFVRRLHRHSVPVVSHRFSLAARELGGGIRGVAICGRPTARGLDMRTTVEVLRVATDGCRNACSFLYGASCVAARALGYARVVTYTLASEPGTSLEAAGFVRVAEVDGERDWTCASRPRPQQSVMFGLPKREAVARVRWLRILS